MPDARIPAPSIDLPPTQAELPYDDGVPMESFRHKAQMDLLIDALNPWLAQRDDGFVSGNMFVYYSLAQVRNQDFRGPDFFVVLDVPKGERKSWVVWEEGKAPDLVIELLSESTADIDKTEKKLIYQNQMRVPEYFWYDPFNPDDWAGFALRQHTYQPLTQTDRGQFLSDALGLALQKWPGTYRGVNTTWLRWATVEGTLLPTAEELAADERQRADQEQQRADQEQQRADQERQRAEQERQRAEQERQRAEQEQQRATKAEGQLLQTAQNLLTAGMTVDQVAAATGLSPTAIAALLPEP